MSNLMLRILVLLISLSVEATGAAPSFAKSNCSETCGNVTIPFPFGVGAGCFLDDWYEIECQQSNTLPILKKNKLQVLRISLPDYERYTSGMISVNLPFIYSNSCSGDRPGGRVSFQGGPFVFSQARNVFAMVGCNTLATMSTMDSSVVGCRSKCAGTNTNSSRYYSKCTGGDQCCQSTLPSNLQVFDVDFKEEGEIQGCQYAFLANTSWFLKSEDRDLSDLRLDNAVPAELEWGISENSSYIREHMSQNASPIYCSINDSQFSYGGSLSGIEMPFVQCYCRYGYQGNPYLPKGCEGKILHAITFYIQGHHIAKWFFHSGFFFPSKEVITQLMITHMLSCLPFLLFHPRLYKAKSLQNKIEWILVITSFWISRREDGS